MIGLSTYAFFWQWSSQAPKPLDLAAMLRRTREAGLGLFQICDHPQLLELDQVALADLRQVAEELGVRLEIGSRGVDGPRLSRLLDIAIALDASLVRSMLCSDTSRPTLREAEHALREALERYEDAGVTLALETYEQVPTADLIGLIKRIGSPRLGICLDPANCVAALENPREVIDRCAPYVVNVHVKDFAFTRQAGWVGFQLAGAEMGTGLLDYGRLESTVRPTARGINRIVEHWVPWQGAYEPTAHLEESWTIASLNHLKEFP
jgi:sugar phosphate isomerase/epimerase